MQTHARVRYYTTPGSPTRSLLVLLLMLSLALADAPARAATAAHQVTLAAIGATSAEGLGSSLAISGDTLVAGAPGGEGNSVNTGLARVLVQGATGWAEQATLIAPDGAYSDRFGASVAIDGDTIIVGAPQRSGEGGVAYVGVVYVFTRLLGVWGLQAMLTSNDRVLGGYHDFFGGALALEGDTLVVASNRISGGAAYVFTRTSGIWSQQAKLTASDGSPYGGFGASIAISQGQVLIGAPGQAAAYLFEREANRSHPWHADLYPHQRLPRR